LLVVDNNFFSLGSEVCMYSTIFMHLMTVIWYKICRNPEIQSRQNRSKYWTNKMRCSLQWNPTETSWKHLYNL
jgi:hypothetical protein